MAFHPFHFFRKRQKTLLAVLTILAMFIFILTGFSGDIMNQAGRWFGLGSRKDKTEVTKLYGKTVTVGDADELLQNRRLANNIVLRAVLQSTPHVSDSDRAEVNARLDALLRDANRFRETSILKFLLQNYQQELRKADKPEAARYLAHLLRSQELQVWAMSHPKDLYFGGTTELDSLLDFFIWRHEADRLNITLTDADVRKEVNNEADSDVLTGDAVKDAELFRRYLNRQYQNVEPKQIYAALRDEFRVRLAQEAILGSSGGVRQALANGLARDDVPAGSTPEQFWQFYKDNRTTLKVDFLKIPVSKFTDRVADEPKGKELDLLFEKYKKDEPNPALPTPGFKEPHKVKVEWVAADPTSPYYRDPAANPLEIVGHLHVLGIDLPYYPDAAARARAILPLTQSLAVMGSIPATGGVPCGAAGIIGPLALLPLRDLHTDLQYEDRVKGVRSWWDPNIPSVAGDVVAERMNPYATGLGRSETVAAIFAQLGTASAGTPVTAACELATTLAGSVEVRRAEQRARNASMVLAGSSMFPLGVAAQEAALAHVPVPTPEAMRGELAEAIRGWVAPALAQSAMASFVKGLEEKKGNPEESAKYIQENANLAHGITGHGIMDAPRSEADIADDKAMEPLKRAREGKTPLTLTGKRQFGQEFLTVNQLYQPREFFHFSTTAPTQYWYWVTQNEKAQVQSFAEARPKVIAAWKFNKARDLADAEARKIVDDLKKRGEGIAPERFLNDEAARLGYERFSPPPIAKLDRPLTPQANPVTQYAPYQFTESTIPYARSDTVNELFDKLKEPGDAVIIKDRPQSTYYVAVLEKREVPSESQFFDIYSKASSPFLGDSLWQVFQTEQEKTFRTKLIRQLRKDAGAKLDEQDDYTVDPEVRRRLRGGSGEE